MRIVALFLLLSWYLPLQASHIVGGNISVEQTGRNQFFIDVSIFRDCRPATATLVDPLEVRVFNRADTSDYYVLFLPQVDTIKPKLGDKCFEPPNLCVEEYHLQGTVNLPDNPNGYIVVAHICCRNSIVQNILSPSNTGMTITTEIPDPALPLGNDSPQLGPFPQNGFFCVNNLRSLDLSATDIDGDSLYYELVNPYTSSGTQTDPIPAIPPPPYSPVNWASGFGRFNPIPASPPVSLDPQTGELRVRPTQLGLYVFAYKVSEYRNGEFIGSTRRDLQVEVLNCIINQLPAFTEPQDSVITSVVGEEICITVGAKDPNPADTLILTSNYQELIASAAGVQNIELAFRTDTGTASAKVCYIPSCAETFSQQRVKINLNLVSIGCSEIDTVRGNFIIDIEPLPDQLDELVPNVFTPNGDNINDRFRLKEERVYPCTEELEIRIYNRWGTEVYHNSLNDTQGWDGRYNGEPVAQGVYFFTISTNYNDSRFQYKGFLTLSR